MTPTMAMAATAIDITALCSAIGALACLLWILPMSGLENREPASHARRLWQFLALCLAVLTLGSLVLLLYRSHVLSDLPYGQLWPVLPKVLAHTHYGHIWLVRIAAVGGGWLIWWLGRRHPGQRRWAAVMAAVMAVIAFTRSATGHSADQGDFTLMEFMDWLHILAGSVWAGGVVAFTLMLLNGFMNKTATAPRFNFFVHRLSRLATAAVLVVLVSGAYNTWQKLLTIDTLWETDYGRHLLWKIGLVGIMLGLGAANRFLHLKKLPMDSPGGANEAAAQRLFRRFLRIEALAAVAVFIAAAILINTLPPHAGMGDMSGMKM